MYCKRTIVGIITIVILIIFLPLESIIRIGAPTEFYRFYAGFVLSIISTTAFAVFVNLIKSLKRGTVLKDIDPNKWTRPFSMVVIVFLFVLGLLIWYVSWEGAGTGVWYGFGFFIGAVLTELGLGYIIKSGH